MIVAHTSGAGKNVPLSVLDLSPFSSGSQPRDGLSNTIDLAQRAEEFGYERFWLAEHHANPGISGSAPHVLAALIAASTSRIRVGTAATILANYEPIQVAEVAGLVASLYGGRFDLGLGRSGSFKPDAKGKGDGYAALAARSATDVAENRIVDGLVVPAPRFPKFDAARFAVQARLLGRADGDADDFPGAVDDILSFLRGRYVSEEGVRILATPAQDSAGLQVWIHGSTAGPSARLAGAKGLPFGANYHVAPSFVVEAVAEYRAAFKPSAELSEPRVIVSVDAVVGVDDEAARELAAGYPEWVLSIRSGQGAIPFPTPDETRARSWTDEERATVQDRVDTQFVGSPETVVSRLETLQRVTGADELLITTITHDHHDRVESYRLLADAWRARA
jgi:alkanesulfonate monooxygenase SsuD/methylene tetrahydromethanopterin reductase-like flavin-dependent oxidoreductase (luciferase family)